MKTLAERLAWARDQKSERDGADFTQADLATRAGVSQGAIGHLESGRTSTSRSITSIAKALEVDPVWLAEGRGMPYIGASIGGDSSGVTSAIPGAMHVKLVDDHETDFYQIAKVTLRLEAGITGIHTEPDNRDGGYIGVPKAWADRKGYNPEQLLAINVKGASMEPTLYEDDMIVVNLADKTPQDNGIFAVNYEGEAIVKRMSRDAGEWWLTSDNTDQRRYHRKLCRTGECIIVGRVVRREGDNF